MIRASALVGATPAELVAAMNGGYLDFYSGTAPATPDDAVTTQTKLFSLRFRAAAFGALSGGVYTAAAMRSVLALSAGTIGWARVTKSDGTSPVCDLTVGTSLSDVLLNALVVPYANYEIAMVSFTVADADGAVAATGTVSLRSLVAPAALSVVVNDVLTDFLAAIDGLTEYPVKIYGPQDEPANNPAPPFVGWTIGKESWGPGQHQGKPGSPAALFTREIPVTFEIMGGINPATTPSTAPPSTSLNETDRSEALMAKLVNAFHRRLTQGGYRIVEGGWGVSARNAEGMAYILTISFLLPLVREDNPVAHVAHVNPAVEFSDEA